MTKRDYAEDQLHIAVADYLKVALPQNACWFHCPNGGGRNKREAAIRRVKTYPDARPAHPAERSRRNG